MLFMTKQCLSKKKKAGMVLAFPSFANKMPEQPTEA